MCSAASALLCCLSEPSLSDICPSSSLLLLAASHGSLPPCLERRASTFTPKPGGQKSENIGQEAFESQLCLTSAPCAIRSQCLCLCPAEAEGSVAPRLLSQNEVPKRLTSCGRARSQERPGADDCSQYQVDTAPAPPQHRHQQHNINNTDTTLDTAQTQELSLLG